MSTEPWCRRGLERARRGDFAGAAGDFRRALAAAPDDQAAWQGLARAALALQDLREASRAVETMITRFPDSAVGHLLAGHVDKARGNTAGAMQSYRRALACDGGAGEALFGLADLEPTAADPELAHQARQVADDSSAPVPDRVNAAFALARIFDAARDFAAAMDYLTTANELARTDLARQGIVYDPAEVAAQISATMAAYTRRRASTAAAGSPARGCHTHFRDRPAALGDDPHRADPRQPSPGRSRG
ncbi:MAG: tetratricopeptide repeat protein [Gammaproteobacteria bacterium]|nr:tetratricopeptide repeat protein [Gammaproteobacteria bacterium]